nr:hypothetical protein [Tanacetum cinerariifolium]
MLVASAGYTLEIHKNANIDDIVRGLTRSGWFGFVYRGGLPGTGEVRISTKEEPTVPIHLAMIDLLKVQQ